MVGINTRRTDCSDAEWIEYCNMSQIHDNETPSEWMKRIWERLIYFRENNLFPSKSNKYLEARRLILLPNSGSYAPEIRIAICFSCDHYNEYLLKVKKIYISGYDYDNEYALHQYGLWMQNAIKKIERAREIGRKIQAVNVIQQKWLEYFYRPDGLCATELAQYYQLLWVVREEMRQVNNI
ncbi:hypothetical protein C2G38_2189573 [Gigaspora rosea]|uniref:Uncharacterized protein n=1 Tax=Gigaspora rosea TaxID=44941 RepID=A0A397VBA8_9GLOM|nr:hypothetical protein C2G38_2189573 [Gigaspora rosea]